MRNDNKRSISLIKLFNIVTFSFFLLFLIGLGAISLSYSITPQKCFYASFRTVSSYAFSFIYKNDMSVVEKITDKYFVGSHIKNEADHKSQALQNSKQELLILQRNREEQASRNSKNKILFVYENPDSEYLKEFRNKHKIELLFDRDMNEFEKMITIASWLGTLWDHGKDIIDVNPKLLDLNYVIEEGKKGKKFWCEIAAITAVKTASSLGWPSRMVTLSLDGYSWDHAVAEYWSNQFEKWFVLDTDFNVFYKSNGIPLSAFELCRYGIELSAMGRLETIQFAPLKKSLKNTDILPFYNYIYIDMRNDWASRPLKRGSPAGGELMSWWTSRESTKPIITAKKRIDQKYLFDWDVNNVKIEIISTVKIKDGYEFIIGLSGYSPYFKSWIVSINNFPWKETDSVFKLKLKDDFNTISARMALTGGNLGPIETMDFCNESI